MKSCYWRQNQKHFLFRFASPLWSVRNAALQLFGALVPRILGQKKVRDDDSAHNTITVAEFFTRYAKEKDIDTFTTLQFMLSDTLRLFPTFYRS